MKQFADLVLPDAFQVHLVERNAIGETNDVYFCKGTFHGRAIRAYVKANKNPQLSLANEQAVLDKLKTKGFPVPAVLWYGGPLNEVLVVEAVAGDVIWDFVDPRRGAYDRKKALLYLHAYGEYLGRVHGLAMEWPPQRRPRLYGPIGEEKVQDGRFERVIAWLGANRPAQPAQVFVHGDYNTASVLFRDDSISGVIDWEFAGSGWKEYDLAWALRARTCFLNTQDERDAILDGYTRQASYDEEALRWCETLNYLHFAYWSRDHEPSYTTFALDRATGIAGIA